MKNLKIKFGEIITLVALFVLASNSMAIPVPGDGDGDGSPAWIAQFNVSSSFAKVGKPVYVQWTSAFAVSCSLWTNQNGSRAVATSGSTTVTPNRASTMSVRISCAGTSGPAVSRTNSFSVNREDHPELLSLNAERVGTSNSGADQLRLSWSSSFSDYCELTGTYQETLPASGTRTFDSITGDSRFSMVCKKYDGRSSNTITRRLDLPRIEFFFADNSTTIQPVYILRWEAHADYCRLDGRQVDRSGWQVEQSGATHQLTCFRQGQSTTQFTRVGAFNSFNDGGGDPILDLNGLEP